MAYRDIPLYPQLAQTCGLSSLLMIAIPEGNSLEYLLTDIVKRLKLGYYERALGWQIAEGYLLMKCPSNRTLSYYLRKEYPDDYLYFKILIHYQMESIMNKLMKHGDNQQAYNINLYLKRGIVRTTTLYEYVTQMKTNLELKILSYLFGGKQVAFPSTDGTGCLFFDGENDEEKLNILYNCVSDGVILGSGHHWTAVQGIEQVDNSYSFTIHDPLGSRRTELSTKYAKNNRFYAFQFDDSKRKDWDGIIRRALKLPLRKGD